MARIDWFLALSLDGVFCCSMACFVARWRVLLLDEVADRRRFCPVRAATYQPRAERNDVSSWSAALGRRMR